MTNASECGIVSVTCRRSFFCAQFCVRQIGLNVREKSKDFRAAAHCVGRQGGNLILGGAVTMRVKITLVCQECKQRNYDTVKNKKNDPDRLEMNKYCRFCRKHTPHKETK